ncbi:MAG: lipid II:glycine glycyltransferase FemX, partial [Microgenomates group bacterium]
NYEILRLGIYSNNNLVAIAQVIKIKARRGNFLFIPHGPILTKNVTHSPKYLKSLISQFLNFLISISKNESFSFIRIAPLLENREEYQKIFQELGFRIAPLYMHAETVWVLSLNQSEDEILSQMRKTTRYLIRKAQRYGVIIEKRTDEKAVEEFYKIYQETAKREKFTPFSKEFIKGEFEAFYKTGNALFLFGKIKTNFNQFQLISTNFNYLASALIIFTKSTAFYHQGASLHSKIPVSYLLQWEAIREAKKRGCQLYNFWGIYDEKSGRTPKSWQGLTLFKTGFGGQAVRYLPTQDYIISPKYYLSFLWEKILMWKRGR